MASIRAYRTPKSGERRYEVRWRENGAAKSKSLTTLADARAFASETERRIRMGTLHTDKAQTFGDLEDAWVERFTAGLEGKHQPRAKTLESVETTRLHLKPLRKVPVDKIDLAKLEQVILPIAQRGNQRTAKMTLELAKRILKSSAKRKQPIDLSALEAYVARSVPREAVYLTWEQVEEVESHIPGEFIRRIVPLAVLTLARQGELLGLRDRDVDHDNATLQITGQAQDGKRVTTKTAAGRRTIDLGPLALNLIREQQQVRAPNKAGLIFPSKRGMVFDRNRFYGRYFKPAAVAAGLPQLTFHGLRHTGASLMIAAGIDVKTISERMGHTDGGALVLRTYGHLYKGRGREAALKLEQLVNEGGTNP